VTVFQYARKCKKVVTVEDHLKTGGLGATIAEYLASVYPVSMEFIGVDDIFGESGDEAELYEKYSLDAESIAAAALRLMEKDGAGEGLCTMK
jgi:transketolase